MMINAFLKQLKRVRALLIVGLCLLPAAHFADASTKSDVKPVVREAQTPEPFKVTLGKAELINISQEFSDILVANPSIINVSAISPRKLYLVGASIGDTNIFVLDSEGDVVRRIDVHVTYDLQRIQSMVERFFPDEQVIVDSIHDQVVLTGTASSPDKANKIANLVGQYVSDLQDVAGTTDELINNMLDVRGEQQVALRVKIVEASRSVIKELGLETRFNDPDELNPENLFNLNTPTAVDTDGTNNIGLISQLLTASQLGLTQDPLSTGRFITDTGIAGLDLAEFLINALEQENLINTLAEPNLTTISGETAGFLAGGEFPVPVGRDQIGNIVIEFRSFGVSLNFRPTIISEGRISLQLETEVSSLNFEDGVPLTGGGGAAALIPAFDVRRASTTVEMGSGSSLMIAGLLESQATKGLTGLPGIKDTPVLGDLVSSDSFQRDETEVMIIVTPYLVRPTQDNDAAEVRQERKDNKMAMVFEDNMRRLYPIRNENEVFGDNNQFGYILD